MLSVRALSRPGLGPASFDLADGECLAVRGKSGSGKTLLLRVIADLDPNSGAVTLDEQPRAAMPAPLWRRQVCYLATEPGWWADRLGDHFPDWGPVPEYLEALGLPSDCRGARVSTLSTGERQRLALIRTLLVEPRVLLLDEPTSGLDADTTAAVERLLLALLASGTGIIWVTHDDAQARRVAHADLLVVDGAVERQAR